MWLIKDFLVGSPLIGVENMDNYLEKLEREMRNRNFDLEYINLLKDYAKRLLDHKVAVIFDQEHFSLLTEVPVDTIKALLNNFNSYNEIQIPKKNGGNRTLLIPNEELKSIQRWILNNILNSIPISDYAKGFKKGLSIVKNAEVHTNKECLLNIDLTDFFSSIESQRVYKAFRYIGYTKEISAMLSRLCTYNNFLPQGSPTSPYLANIICKKMDKRLFSLCKDKGIDYTRYADDLTFSGDIMLSKYLPIISEIVEDEGFQINTTKTRISYQHHRQVVTGLTVNKGLNIPRDMKKKLSQEIYFCKKYGVQGHLAQTGQTYSNYKHYLLGKAYFIKMVNKELGEKFIRRIAEIAWDY